MFVSQDLAQVGHRLGISNNKFIVQRVQLRHPQWKVLQEQQQQVCVLRSVGLGLGPVFPAWSKIEISPLGSASIIRL